MMKHILREEESQRLRADGMNDSRPFDIGAGERTPRTKLVSPGKRRRFDADGVMQRGNMRSVVLDAVYAGLCTEVHGRELFDLYV